MALDIERINQQVLADITFVCKLHGIDYLTLDKKTQDLYFEIFRKGAVFVSMEYDRIKREADKKLKDNLDEIPF